jgi:hypothetical protein
LRRSRSQIAIIVLLALNASYCLFSWPPAFLCNGVTAWAEWFVVAESLLMIGIVPLLAIAIRLPSVRTAAIYGGVLTLAGIGVIGILSARQILECA